MARKTASSRGTSALAEASPAPNPTELRPGASINPEMVNVFQQAVSPGAPRGLHLAPIAGRPSGDAIALSVLAWVRNVAYDKDLWVDLHVLDDDGNVLHAEIVPLTYQEPAEGGGDFFAAGAAVPAPKATAGAPAHRTVAFRLYGQLHGQLYTDGILHTHRVEAPAGAKAPAGAAAATEPAAPKASRTRAASSDTAAAARKTTTRKPRTPKA